MVRNGELPSHQAMLFRKNTLLTFLFLFILGSNCLGQVIEQECYWIVSFERVVAGKEAGTYYWITDDVSGQCTLYPLSLPTYPIRNKGVFPGDCLSDCNGYPLVEQVQFADQIADQISGTFELIQCVSKNKRLIQRIKKQWKDHKIGKGMEDLRRKKEIISIYATPVQGVFESGIRVLAYEQIQLVWRSFRPVSDIQACERLWEKDEAIKYINFSFVQFAALSSPWISTADNVHLSIPKVSDPESSF